MTLDEADKLLDLIDRSGVAHERRRNRSSTNRRGEVAGVIANLEAASQVGRDNIDAGIAAAVEVLLGNPT